MRNNHKGFPEMRGEPVPLLREALQLPSVPQLPDNFCFRQQQELCPLLLYGHPQGAGEIEVFCLFPASFHFQNKQVAQASYAK